MAKLPSFQFYPGDWMKDPALRRCSAAARGIWMDVLCLMFESDERGKLVTSALQWTLQDIAEAISGDTATNLSHLKELLAKGVMRQDESGCYYSNRLVKDELVRKQTKERVRQLRSRNADVTVDVTPLYEDEDEEKAVDVVVDLKEPNFAELIYADYPRKVGKAASLKAIGKALLKIQRHNSFNELDAAQFLHKAVIEYSRSPAGNRGEYTPHCATWMNQERWTDDRTEWQKDYRNGTNQSVNRSRARQDAQRDELRRAEEMDSQGTFDSGDYDERNSNGGSLKRLCESVGGPAATQVAKGIPTGRANPEILPKASRTN